VQIKPKDKRPLGNDWQKRATSDPETLKVLWQFALDANVGVQMGRGDEPIIDIECDSPEAEESYQALWDGAPPAVPTYRGRRGRHYLYHWRDGFPAKAAYHVGPLEVRTGNGDKGAQSVFPPSIHPTGAVYAWEPGLTLDDVPLGVLPDEIVEKLQPASDKTPTTSTADSEVPPMQVVDDDEATEQARHWLFKIPGTQSGVGQECDKKVSGLAIGLVHGFALPEEIAVDLLTEWGQRDDQLDEHGLPYPWTAKEMQRKVAWAAGQSYDGMRGDKLWRNHHDLDAAVEAIIQPAPSVEGQPTIFDAARVPQPVAKTEAPEDIADIIEAEQAKERQTPRQKQDAKVLSFCNLVTSAELLAMDLRPEFLVKGVLVKGQPCIIGGRSKAMKTSIAVDLAISLGSGAKFLGKYDVPKPVKVAFWTGESGAPTIRETAVRVAKSKGIELKDCQVSWSFDLPKLCRLDHLAALEQVIREQRLEVVVIDPLYLSLLSAETAGSAGNLYAMGAALEPLSRLAQATGATVILLHHFKKSGIPDPDNPAALEDLSQSGAAEWARQWILLQRRTPYNSDGVHDLWLRAGGSAGHSSLVAVTVEEGLIDPDTGSGRHWRVVVSNRAQAIVDDKMKKVAEKQVDKEKKQADLATRVVKVLEDKPDGETEKGLREAVGANNTTLKPVLQGLLLCGTIEECKVRKYQATYDGYRLEGQTGQTGQTGRTV